MYRFSAYVRDPCNLATWSVKVEGKPCTLTTYRIELVLVASSCNTCSSSWRLVHFSSRSSTFSFQASLSLKGLHGAKTSPRLAGKKEKIKAALNILWASSKAFPYYPLGRFWTKDKSNTEKIIVSSSRVFGSWEEKIFGIFIKGVTSPKASSSITRVHFGEASCQGDLCPRSQALLVKIGGEVGSSTVKVSSVHKIQLEYRSRNYHSRGRRRVHNGSRG